MLNKRLSLYLCVLSLLCVFSNCLSAQETSFKYDKKEYLLASSFALWSSGHLFDKYKPSEQIDDFEDVDYNSLNSLDRSAVNNDSFNADRWSDRSMYAAIATPVLLSLTDSRIRKEALSVSLMGLQGYFFVNGVTQWTKTLVERPRPYIYKQGIDVLNVPIAKADTKSFFSGHTSNAAFFSFFSASILVYAHPDSKLKPLIWTAAAALPAVTGFLRYEAGKHFPTDIITGYIFGGAIGYFLPKFYKQENLNIGVAGNGMSLSLVF